MTVIAHCPHCSTTCRSCGGPRENEYAWLCKTCLEGGKHPGEAVSCCQQLEGAVAEAEKWKRIAQDRCTCVKACGDTPEASGGICKELPRGGM